MIPQFILYAGEYRSGAAEKSAEHIAGAFRDLGSGAFMPLGS
jgi:hypothetical protein